MNVYSGRVVGYELEERVWGGDWSGVEDSGTAESGVGWNLLWRENEYRWKPIFENGIEPDGVQVRQVVVSATPINATCSSPFANGSYNYQGSSGGGTTTAEPAPESWPFAVGEPSVNGENAISMSVTLSGVNLNNNSSYCVATSNVATLTQQNTEETAADRPRVAITEVQRVVWEEPTDSSRPTRLQDDPQDSGTAQRFFPEQLSPTSNVVANQIGATVTFAAPIPTGMEGTVSLELFDPANPYCSVTTPTFPYPISSGKRDNNGAAELSTIELTFNQSLGTSKRSATLTVTQANAGDNYVVAAHPNASGVDRYWITETFEEDTEQLSGSPIMRPNDENNASVALAENLQTPKLTVWRTLWVEYDYMTLEGVTVAAPTFPAQVKEHLTNACIDAQTYLFNLTPSVEGTALLPQDWDDAENYADACRNISSATPNLWTLHIIDAFYLEEKPKTLGGHYENQNTIFIFNQAIQQRHSNYFAMAKNTVLLHEIGHAFNLDDYNKEKPETALHQNTIMHAASLDLSISHTYTTKQLQIIQASVQPQ